MGAEGVRRSMGTKGARRKMLSTWHPSTVLKPNPDPTTHTNPQPRPTPTPTPTYPYPYPYLPLPLPLPTPTPTLAESPPANPRFFLEGAHGPRGRHRVFSAKPDGAPTGDPPPHGWVHATTASPPPPPSAPPKRDSGAEGWGYSPMPRGHESTWPYTGRYTPAPPPRTRGAPVVPRAGSNPPPPGNGRPREPSPSPRGPLGVRPRASPALPRPPLTSRSPRARPVSPAPARELPGPGPQSLVPSPARPPGIPPAGPVPVRFGRKGTARRSPRLHQDSPPWMTLGGIRPRRAGCGPHR